MEDNCFTVLCSCLLYSSVNQPCVYIYPLLLEPPSHPPLWVVTEPRAELPVYTAAPTSCLFYTPSCIELRASLSIHPALSFPRWVHRFVPYACVSVPAQQLGSSVPFSRFHIYALTHTVYFPLHHLLHSVITGSSTADLVSNLRVERRLAVWETLRKVSLDAFYRNR